MKELAFILGVIRFINTRLTAIIARAEKRHQAEVESYEAMKASFEKRAAQLVAAKNQAELVNNNLRNLTGE